MLLIIALLLAAAVILFYALQKYIVYGQEGLSLELPFLQPTDVTAGPATSEAGGAVAEVEIVNPDFSSVAPVSAGDLPEIRAVYVPAEEVGAEGLADAAASLDSRGANALVVQMKPPEGQLAWASQVKLAASYGVNGTAALGETVAALKEQGVYLVAALSCCVDEYMATRNLPLALRDSSGGLYSDSARYWLDPYNKDARAYISELCGELADMGFDELLLEYVAHPDADVVYSRQMSGEADRVTAVSGLALALTDALKDKQVTVSALMDAQAFRTDERPVNGQDLSFFLTVFGRVYAASDGTALESDRARAAEALGGEESLNARFVPVLPSAPGSGSWLLMSQR